MLDGDQSAQAVADLHIDLSVSEHWPAIGGWLPDQAFVRLHAAPALAACLPGGVRCVELSVRLVGPDEGRTLNRRWRGIDRATNVLSFESGLPVLDGLLALGDLVFCPAVIAREADEYARQHSAHWAHLVVHGTLHLLGYDHIDEADAACMEALEIRLLSQAGIADPYDGTAERP